MHRTLRSKLLISRKNVNVFLHIHVRRECSAEQTLYAQHPVSLEYLSPVLAYDFLSRCKFSTLTSTPLYSSINRLYAQNPGFEIVHWESVKIYLHICTTGIISRTLFA